MHYVRASNCPFYPFRRAHSRDIMRLLGLKPGGHLPPKGMFARRLPGVKKTSGESGQDLYLQMDILVWVKPVPPAEMLRFPWKSSTHRVMSMCPDCGRTVPVGRLFQHRCKP